MIYLVVTLDPMEADREGLQVYALPESYLDQYAVDTDQIAADRSVIRSG